MNIFEWFLCLYNILSLAPGTYTPRKDSSPGTVPSSVYNKLQRILNPRYKSEILLVVMEKDRFPKQNVSGVILSLVSLVVSRLYVFGARLQHKIGMWCHAV